MSGSEFVELFVGVGAARVRDLFAQADAAAPCIIFIDELDALARARGVAGWTSNEEREQTLNQLLVEMDGFDTSRGVIILAATNRPEILDPAILRPGRFDRQIALDRPDINGREQILRVHVKRIKLAESVNLRELAGQTAGFTGAELANVTNEAALLAARHGKDEVAMSDFTEAIDRVVGGLEKKTRVMNALEKRTVAYHEAGHALVAELSPTAVHVGKISIIPRGVAALGYTKQVPTEDRYLLKRTELLERIDVLLAGRVAEEIAFGDVSTGAQDDLARATELAWHMVAQYGMSDSCGLVSFDPSRTPVMPIPGLPRGSREYSDHTADTIDSEVRSLLEAAHQRVRTLLAARRGTLDALAAELLVHEVMERADLLRIIGTAAPPPPPGA
jgi:cell division protease FtsH